jgi:hypothetical protein
MSKAWFSRQGEALAPAEQGALADLLGAHPALGDAQLAVVTSWGEAAAIVRAGEWDTAWWDVEETEREVLWQTAADRLGESAVVERVTAASDALAPTIREAVRIAATMGGLGGTEIPQLAAGAALLALQQATLADLAGAGAEHYFVRKLALFAMGRWPLGLVRTRYYVF